MVVQYTPVVPAQTVQGVNWALERGNQHWWGEGTYSKHTDWLLGAHTDHCCSFLQQLKTSGVVSFYSLTLKESTSISESITIKTHAHTTSTIQSNQRVGRVFLISQNLHQQDGVVVHRWRILHLHGAPLEPLHRAHGVFRNSTLSPVKNRPQMSLKRTEFSSACSEHRVRKKEGTQTYLRFDVSSLWLELQILNDVTCLVCEAL